MNLLRKLIDKNDPASLKGFVALSTTIHFIIAAFIILGMVVYVALKMIKGVVDKDLIGLLNEILKYDFYIIATAVFGNTLDRVAGIWNKNNDPIDKNEELKDT